MVAFALADVRSPTFDDPNGRPLGDFFTIEAGVWVAVSGSVSFLPLDVHKCSDEEYA